MLERKLIKEYEFKELDNTRKILEIKLNKFISTTIKAKK
jgi:predicted nucleic-acid-binding Zn-ribbon protein